MKRNKGFTLIELLVVIAIIGVLASVVLASLNTARNKGNVAAVKSNLSGVRAQAEILYDDDGDYDAVCGVGVATSTNTRDAFNAAADANGSAGSATCGATSSPAGSWAIAADLPGGGAFCVDNNGTARTETSGGTDYTGDTEGATPALDSGTDSSCN